MWLLLALQQFVFRANESPGLPIKYNFAVMSVFCHISVYINVHSPVTRFNIKQRVIIDVSQYSGGHLQAWNAAQESCVPN